MKQHIVPSIVASVVAVAASFALAGHFKPEPDTKVIVSSTPISDAKAERLARAEWGEMTQKEVDDLTAELAGMTPPAKLTILCANERWCGDVALNLDNAFESAHWPSGVVYSPMMAPPGWMASTPELVKALNDATGGRFDVRVDPAAPQPPAPGVPGYVVIGQKLPPKKA